MKCEYIMALYRPCPKNQIEGSQYCDWHISHECVTCGNQATHQCHHSHGIICGKPVCETCLCKCCDQPQQGGPKCNDCGTQEPSRTYWQIKELKREGRKGIYCWLCVADIVSSNP